MPSTRLSPSSVCCLRLIPPATNGPSRLSQNCNEKGRRYRSKSWRFSWQATWYQKVFGFVMWTIFVNHRLIFFPDQQVIPGNIIVRQRGTLFHPGQHVCDFVLDIDLSLSRWLSGQDGTGPHNIRRCTWVCSVLQGEMDARHSGICWCRAGTWRGPSP